MAYKTKLKTHKNIDEFYASKGVNVSKLNKEFKEKEALLVEAIKRVKRRKKFGGIFYNPFIEFGVLKPEVEEEWNKLKEKAK